MNQDKKGHTAVFGIFDNRSSLERSVGNLKDSGFNNADISALLPNKQATQNFAHEKSTKAPEGATTGLTGGLVLGGGLGWLVGIGALTIPGIGPFVAAGPLMAAMAGAGIGGEVGGLTGALIGMGIPEYEAKRYEDHLKNGGMLLSVHVDDSNWAKKAKDILKNAGAKDIDTEKEKKSPDSKDEQQFSDSTGYRPVTASKDLEQPYDSRYDSAAHGDF